MLPLLTLNPFGVRICCDVDPDKVSAVEPDDDEGIKQFEGNGRDDEQIHGGDIWGLIAQKGTPSLTGRPRRVPRA